ncbi:MAG: glycyl-radical enzyme activating protein [Clostridiales bacterium]|jgi:pyruvate formate lyase activating enzyme|nr:glycyl-radical enzyme activating protein [Clostridiales bacterium]
MITNIQRYGIHDGGGIRTVVFFKGCPLRCKWCHNPETQSFKPQTAVYPERCAGCGACKAVCGKTQDECGGCGRCWDVCVYGAREGAGRGISPEELANLIAKDMTFYTYSEGGATLSGGEPMAQDTAFLCELLARLRNMGIDAAIDTCGAVPWERFEAALPFAPVFLYDFKTLDPALHKAFTGHDNALILDNLKRLCEAGANVKLRVPVIGGVNDVDEQRRMAEYAGNLPLSEVALLPYHNTGSHKWRRFGMAAPDCEFCTPSKERMDEITGIWEKQGFNSVSIGG